MPDIAGIIERGAQNPWLFLPVALLLGALHALEPGHSKSMMAAFIIAVRGTVAQATVLGLSAAAGHTIVIWALALAGLWLGDKLILEKAEPWLLMATGLLVIALGVRIFLMLRRPAHAASCGHDHSLGPHLAGGPADHHGGGLGGHDHPHPAERTQPPAAATAAGDVDVEVHADDVEGRLAGRKVGTGDIAWFGFSAGLLPCPAAFAVLLVCLQLKKAGLGLAMVAAFSAGLAATLVAVGVAAAWAAAKASERRRGGGSLDGLLDRWGHLLPYASAAIVVTVGLLVLGRGIVSLNLV